MHPQYDTQQHTPILQFNHQKTILLQCQTAGRTHLLAQDYFSSSRQLSKAVLAFQYILKNHPLTPHQVKQLLSQHMLAIYSNLTLCYLKLKDYNMAKTFSQQVLNIDPDNVKALYRKGTACAHLRLYDVWQQCISKGNALDAGNHWKQLKILGWQIQQNDKKNQKLNAKKWMEKGIYGDKYQQKIKCWDKIKEICYKVYKKIKRN